MRLLPALLLPIVLSATGCQFSKVSPDAAVHVTGRALDASGKPLAGAKVLLFKEADIGEVLFGAVIALGTLGTACLVPEAPAICHKAQSVTSGPDGRFAFDLKGSDTQGTLGTEAVLDVVFADPRAGSKSTSTTVSFNARKSSVSLPDARLWNPSPRVSQDSGQVHVSWSSLPSGAGSKPSYSAQLFTSGQDLAFWSQPAQAGRADIDSRILEDKPATVAVGARTTLSGGSNAGTVHASYTSTRAAVNATAGAPPSRGRPCAPVTGATPVVGTMSACGATNGDLATAARLHTSTGIVTGVAVDLGSVRPVRLVVARGVAGQFLVEVSADGSAWRVVSTSIGTAVAVSPAGQPEARYVRVRSASGLDESLLSEVSVW